MKKNKDFDNIVDAVSEIMEIPQIEILDKSSQIGGRARRFICHCIYDGYVHLRETYIERLGVTSASFNKNVREAVTEISTITESLSIVNEIRKAIGLPTIRHTINECPKTSISDTKVLFGFDYTELDALRLRNACRGAAEYMKKLCSIGRRPIPDGLVYSSIGARHDFKSWYNG